MDKIIKATIDKLESVAIRPFESLQPRLGIIVKGTPLKLEKSYIDSLVKQANEYNAKITTKLCSTPQDAASVIQAWKQDKDIFGIIILSDFGQATQALYNMIPARLDVDGLSSYSLGKLWGSTSPIAYRHAPCTPVACLKILQTIFPQGLQGKKVAILGRSIKVGRPLSEIMTQQNATVTLFHSQSYYPRNKFEDYDIIISAIGQGKFLNAKVIDPLDKVLIDVGINIMGYKIYGDFDYDNLVREARYITPVPGGVGKVTTTVLFAKLFANKYAFVEGESQWQSC